MAAARQQREALSAHLQTGQKPLEYSFYRRRIFSGQLTSVSISFPLSRLPNLHLHVQQRLRFRLRLPPLRSPSRRSTYAGLLEIHAPRKQRLLYGLILKLLEVPRRSATC